MSYVDLNPVRAGIADTPENSDFTSIQERIASWMNARNSSQVQVNHEPVRLMRLSARNPNDHPHQIVFSTADYVELVDWAGRAGRDGKRGAIPEHLPKILQRLGLSSEHYLRHMNGEARGEGPVVLGRVERIREAAEQLGRKFLKGAAAVEVLFGQCPGSAT